MTLRARLARLEAKKAPSHGSQNTHEELWKRLARIEARVVASGDASDRPDAPLIERAVRRYLRGEVDPADAMQDLLAGRWP